MSNASLKEQLEALSLGAAATTNKKERHFKKPNRAEKKNSPQQKPAWLEYAQYGVELLKAHFPLCFHDIKEIQPLKIGIKQDLVKALSTREDIVIGDKACMVSSLSYYVNSTAYHKSVVEGAMRIDLDGQAASLISIEESQYSLDCRKAKLEKKKSQPTTPAAKSLEPANG
ncbi:MAG: ProQ/FINO family protein [Pseudomonadota bacterium]